MAREVKFARHRDSLSRVPHREVIRRERVTKERVVAMPDRLRVAEPFAVYNE